ncbi:translation elongation factor Ts [Candidatus Nomurabacteria bacterium RIFCSPLOWO2_01_FULL_42_20]|uniref:Elongation factor Ts n=1 Tax=Candidatus Nomurabacteria bacterium RIFCSPHIGHO2_01_FULL_42_16 TaxID=1801743 RepID=A0A1F6VI36_9BACT|nr:MAG: translation elongation factor Ts [Candidatus Nomurabacteria bacterium RIFCSPHIGHO2_01_FULL_42_16]OGI92645.1 MAG: translation elongation factor Ts [Candidatus Nomurabacteria bacterium RIFCSPLOWO2_01_FULL_42_20]
MITSDQIKELRDQTGISVMQCKKALTQADGDIKKALAILASENSEIASKKADREVKDGLIVIKTDGKKAIMVGLKCETDFVAKSEDFVNLVNQIAEVAWQEGADKAQAETQELINPVIQKMGENIKLGQVRMVEGANLGVYLHNGKTAALASLSGGSSELSKDLAMHVAAMNPESVQALLEQAFVKNQEITVSKLLEEADPDIKINQVVRYSVLE